MTPRYQVVGDYLKGEIEKSKPSLWPEAYPTFDPYLAGFEEGLERAQHIIEVSARYALTFAGVDPTTAHEVNQDG